MELSELDRSTNNDRRMTFRNVRMEIVIPVFTGVLGALVLSMFVVMNTRFFPLFPVTSSYVPFELTMEVTGSYFLSVNEQVPDPVMEYYRKPEYQDWVINFFAGICSNKEVAKAILQYTDEYNVSASLAFALSWEESRFDPRAINRFNRDGSIDRGLFQLNNRSFPHLENAAFYDIDLNARYGISHLRHCLNTGSSEVSALAMYNAGAGRVRSTGAPEVTLNYISRILNNKSKIESRFHTMLIKEEENRLEENKDSRNAIQPQSNRTLTTVSPLIPSL